MQITGKTIRKVCVLAGLTVMAAASSAAWLPADTQIMIDRALNSPTLTVRYNGANAAIVELRINGESIGTRSVAAAKNSGETNFTIDLNSLKDGDNEVEIRLFDRAGKLVGSDKTNISTDQGNRGPVFVKAPKVGATVQGPVEIALGFGKDLKNVYVSFFVDNDFKKMTNYPPYSFMWDTALETNGWHEIEAWVIDETSTTYKTKKTRIFVNNPGGRTDRKGVETELTPRTNPQRTAPVGAESGLKTIKSVASGQAVGTSAQGAAPKLVGKTSKTVKPSAVGAASGLKPIGATPVLATGAKNMAPTQTLIAKVDGPRTAISAATNNVNAATGMISITKGQKIPNLGSFAVVLNSQFVNFDVTPRVENGVPMTPFRHLLEKAGGTVGWENSSKTVKADADGKNILIQIGDMNAQINNLSVSLERAPYLEKGRTIVPLSFLRDVLNVNIEFDRETGHVLITTLKK